MRPHSNFITLLLVANTFFNTEFSEVLHVIVTLSPLPNKASIKAYL